MNPYAKFLDGRDALEVIGATAGTLKNLITGMDTEKKPAPGKWCAREVLCHLADCEVVFAYRLRQTLAMEHHVIQPFDQDDWARNYAAYDAATALAVFSAVRGWNQRLIRSVMPGAAAKKVTHPERGEMTFAVVVETMAGHDLNHIGQIERLKAGS